MSRRIMAQHMPRSNSQWGELAGSSLYVYRPFSYSAASPNSGEWITEQVWSFSHVIELENI